MQEKRLTVKEIEKGLYDEYTARGHKYFSSNTYGLGYEADFITVSPDFYSIEFEIKRSKADFFSEFKHKKEKHDKIKNGELSNYFYFISESNIIDIKKVPSYCGLIYVSRQKGKFPYHLSMIRVAPQLHDMKISKDMILKLQTTIINKYYQSLR